MSDQGQWLQIEQVDGKKRLVRILPVDVMRAERHMGKPISLDTAYFETNLYMAYSASKRAGFAGDDFDAWCEEIVSVEEGTPDPKA